MHNAITDVPGIKVGHADNQKARTGCSVVLTPPGAMAGISCRGGAPATRETDLLHVDGITQEIHAVLLTGGSAFGLDAAGGVLAWLEEKGIGFDSGVAKVPLVPTLSLFDLAIGRADVRPDAGMGYQACAAAGDGPVAEGSVGAGAGAAVGKLMGMEFCSKSGIGSASRGLNGVILGVLAVSNAFGDLVDAEGEIVSGTRHPKEEGRFLDTAAYLRKHGMPKAGLFANCTFAVVATDARLDRRLATRLAEMAIAGISRTLRPAHTMFDFDVVIAMSCGTKQLDIPALGSAAAELVQEAILRGARAAQQEGSN